MSFFGFSPLFVQPDQPANTSLTALLLEAGHLSININVGSRLWRPGICKSKLYQLFSTDSCEEYLALKLSDVLLRSHSAGMEPRSIYNTFMAKRLKRAGHKTKTCAEVPQMTICWMKVENLWLICFSLNSWCCQSGTGGRTFVVTSVISCLLNWNEFLQEISLKCPT